MSCLKVLEYADKPDYAMISGIFERTMKRRGVRESDPFDWEKAGSDSTQSEVILSCDWLMAVILTSDWSRG